VSHFIALAGGDPCQYRHKWYVAKTRFCGIHFRCRKYWRIFNHFYVIRPKATKFGEITRRLGLLRRDSSDPRQFSTIRLVRKCPVSRHFGTSAVVSARHFGSGTELSRLLWDIVLLCDLFFTKWLFYAIHEIGVILFVITVDHCRHFLLMTLIFYVILLLCYFMCASWVWLLKAVEWVVVQVLPPTGEDLSLTHSSGWTHKFGEGIFSRKKL